MKQQLTEKHVTHVQNASKMCLACGDDNPMSLHGQFLDLEDGSICGLFTTKDEHQSYPGRVHGGIISAMLDETIGRAVQTKWPEIFGVTMELKVKFRHPVPLGVPLKVIAHTDSHKGRVFDGTGQLVLEDGTVAAQGFARYYELKPDEIMEQGLTDEMWHEDKRPAPSEILA